MKTTTVRTVPAKKSALSRPNSGRDFFRPDSISTYHSTLSGAIPLPSSWRRISSRWESVFWSLLETLT
ncbi:MAG TPA: hypothetical protein VKP69_00495 [Isosphaeraceae bacterium]|nr:hypothetical protein [Isosphaeraceae bacterium]